MAQQQQVTLGSIHVKSLEASWLANSDLLHTVLPENDAIIPNK